MVHNYCSSHFHPKTISKQESYAYKWSNLNVYVSKHIFGPNNGQNGQKILFSSFSSQDHFQTGVICLYFTISKEICFWSSKEDFLPFCAHLRAWKRAKTVFQSFSSRKQFQKGVTFLCFTVKVLGPKKGFLALLAHVLGEIGQNGPKLFFSWFWSHTISNKGSHAYVPIKILKNGLNELFLRFWGPVTGQKSTFLGKFKRHLETHS